MMSSFSSILVINSIALTGLILNQNDSSKDTSSTQNSRSSLNPLEKITWICLIGQLILLLMQLKITES